MLNWIARRLDNGACCPHRAMAAEAITLRCWSDFRDGMLACWLERGKSDPYH